MKLQFSEVHPVKSRKVGISPLVKLFKRVKAKAKLFS